MGTTFARPLSSQILSSHYLKMVGLERFELSTPCTPCKKIMLVINDLQNRDHEGPLSVLKLDQM